MVFVTPHYVTMSHIFALFMPGVKLIQHTTVDVVRRVRADQSEQTVYSEGRTLKQSISDRGGRQSCSTGQYEKIH